MDAGVRRFGSFFKCNRKASNPMRSRVRAFQNPCASGGPFLEWVKEVHGHALKARLESDLRVDCALLHIRRNFIAQERENNKAPPCGSTHDTRRQVIQGPRWKSKHCALCLLMQV